MDVICKLSLNYKAKSVRLEVKTIIVSLPIPSHSSHEKYFHVKNMTLVTYFPRLNDGIEEIETLELKIKS